MNMPTTIRITFIRKKITYLLVEFGHRTRSGTGWVEGQFFLTISEQEMQRQSPAIIEARIAKKLGEYFK